MILCNGFHRPWIIVGAINAFILVVVIAAMWTQQQLCTLTYDELQNEEKMTLKMGTMKNLFICNHQSDLWYPTIVHIMGSIALMTVHIFYWNRSEKYVKNAKMFSV